MSRRAAFLALLVLLHMSGARADEPTSGCLKKAEQIKPGMTRDQVFDLAQPDGGLAGIYKGERYYFPDLKFGEEPDKAYWQRKFCMLTIDFRPKGVTDDVYGDPDRFAAWLKAGFKYNDEDIVMRVSAPVMDHYHSD